MTGSLILRAGIGIAGSKYCTKLCGQGKMSDKTKAECYYRCHHCIKGHKNKHEFRLYKIKNVPADQAYIKPLSTDDVCFDVTYCWQCVSEG